MDATGYTMFSALPLMPLTGLFWYLQRFSRQEIGLVWGNRQAYGLALLYPVFVLGLIAVVALMSGAIDTSNTDWTRTNINIALMSTTGLIMVLITEEGFFRGWLWAALARAGQSKTQILIWTTLAFTLWHVSAITLDTGFDVPAAEVPIYLVNATLIGAVFGMLRMASGSVVVPTVCHAVWNGIDYPLYGFGEKVGALGIEQTHVYGPEVGLLGLGLNLAFATVLWLWLTNDRR
jgi:membrane protease YdiL (CAAX protease family)